MQGGQLKKHTLDLLECGSSGGEGDNPKSGILPLQGCHMTAKEEGTARAGGMQQDCLSLPECLGPGWPCQEVPNILEKRVTLLGIYSLTIFKSLIKMEGGRTKVPGDPYSILSTQK